MALDRSVDLEPSLRLPASPLAQAAAPIAIRKGPVRQQHVRLAFLMAGTDALAVLAAFALAYWVTFGWHPPRTDFVLVMATSVPLWVGLFAGFGLYGVHRMARAEEFRKLISAVSLGTAAVVTISFWSDSSVSRQWVGLSWALSILLVLAVRRLWHWRMRSLRAAGELTFPTLIVGTNGEASHLAKVMGSEPMGYRPVGFVSAGQEADRLTGLPVVAGIDKLREAIRATGAECVFVASSDLTEHDMKTVSRLARLEEVEVRISANLPQMLSTRLSVQPFAGLMALSVRPVRLTGPQAAAKRAFDVLLSAIALTLVTPVLAAIAIAIKLTSKGPVLFRQARVGRGGEAFTLLKFRTMVREAESMLDELQSMNEASGPLFKLRNDPRVTRLGRWLRAWSLDELPQLINVLKGDMSLVGPRPPLPQEVRQYEGWHHDRLAVAPGITGLWQVNGRSELSFDDYVRLDLFYVENWSLAYDLFILAKTVPVLFSRRGAY